MGGLDGGGKVVGAMEDGRVLLLNNSYLTIALVKVMVRESPTSDNPTAIASTFQLLPLLPSNLIHSARVEQPYDIKHEIRSK